MVGSAEEVSERYDVCLSFAGEQRNYVVDVAKLLRDAGVRVFYDEYETAGLWGSDLYEHLHEIYNQRSRFCVLFASADYRRKVWTNHERVAAQNRALHDSSGYILPVRFDDSEIPGLRDSIGHVDARHTTPAELVALLLDKLGRRGSEASEPASVLALACEEGSVEVDTILRTALARCGLDPVHQRSGENGVTVAVVPRSSVDVLTSLVPAIESVIDEHNLDVPASPTGRVTLRVAVHRGDVPAGPDWDCATFSAVIAMVQAPVGGELLAAAPRAACVVIVSQRVYTEAVAPGPRGLNPTNYVEVVLTDGQAGWARLPGYPKPPSTRAPRPEARAQEVSAAVPPAKYLFSGNTMTVGNVGDNTGPITMHTSRNDHV